MSGGYCVLGCFVSVSFALAPFPLRVVSALVFAVGIAARTYRLLSESFVAVIVVDECMIGMIEPWLLTVHHDLVASEEVVVAESFGQRVGRNPLAVILDAENGCFHFVVDVECRNVVEFRQIVSGRSPIGLSFDISP